LLENLPNSIPYHDLKSTCYTFSVADDEIEEYGDETSAANRRLEAILSSLTEVPQARILIESSNSMATSISHHLFLAISFRTSGWHRTLRLSRPPWLPHTEMGSREATEEEWENM
jgi:hypothetical protein